MELDKAVADVCDTIVTTFNNALVDAVIELDFIRMTSSDSEHRSLPPLPQDPPTTHATIGSPVESNGISMTDTESYSRRSKIRTRSRSSKESWIHEEITRTYKKLQYQLQDERRRADEAERKLVEVTAHLKTVNEARLIAMQDAAQAKEDLR